MNRYLHTIARFIRKKNLLPKLGSILLAVILWAYISNSKSGDLKFKLPVNISGLESSYVVSKLSHRAVVVEVRGSIDELKNISSRNLRLSVDLSKGEPGEYRSYRIQYQKIDLNDDFRIQLYPEEVKILIEKKTARNVVVIPKYTGLPDKGFIAGKIRVSPEYIRITGPMSVVNRISAVYTDEIPMDGKNSSFRLETAVSKLDEEGLEYSLTSVTASVPVINSVETSTLELPVVIRNKKKGLNYRLGTAAVRITVIPAAGTVITPGSYSAYVDAYELPVDGDELVKKGKIDLSGYVHVTGGTPESDSNIIQTVPDTVNIAVMKE